ncbi:TPA: hypothetical protein F3P23_09460 [Aeromonas hydrophila]|nr:hypothetical protein [Aeromonas hydrophila]
MTNEEKLNKYISSIKSGMANGLKKNIKFPSKNELSKSPAQQKQVLVEQANKLLMANQETLLAGSSPWFKDRDKLIYIFLKDIEFFATEHSIQLNDKLIASFGQTKISTDALFHIARSSLFKASYQSIEMHENKENFNLFSIPFTIRVAIENKLKSIIGFRCSDIHKNSGVTSGTREFPVTLVIDELKRLKCLNLPCSLDELSNIYAWSCNFCHTAEKENIWLILKAIEVIAPLFEYQSQTKYTFDITNLWGKYVLTNQSLCEKMNCYKGSLNPLYYLKEGYSLSRLEAELNNSKNEALKRYKFHLFTEELDEAYGFYCRDSKEHY